MLATCKFYAKDSNEKNYVVRRLRSMREISIHGVFLGEKLFKCNRCNLADYFYTVQNNIVSALMTWE